MRGSRFVAFVARNPGLCLVLLLLGAGGPLAFAAATPLFLTGDETAHVDYAYQVWQGRLPVFEDGIGFAIEGGSRPPVQWASQHPPLFYALLAPVVGPLLDTGHPTIAGMAARGVLVILATLTVCASSWTAAAMVPQLKALRLVVPVVLATSVWFMRLGGAVYNDMLMILFVTLALGATARIVRSGVTRWRVIGLAGAASGAGLSRLSAVPVIIACLCVVAFALRLRTGTRRLDWLRASALPAVAMLVTSGWFYARNVALTGSITGGHPEWSQAHLGRVERPVTEVLVDPAFWKVMARQFAYSPEWVTVGSVVLFVIPMVLGLVVALVRRPTAPDVLLLLLVLGTIAGVSLMQVVYTAGGGAVNGRYLGAVLPQLVLLVGLGLGWSRRAVVPVLAVWLTLRLIDLGLDLRAVLAVTHPAGYMPVRPAVVWLGFGLLVCGAVAALALLAARPGVLALERHMRPGEKDASAPAGAVGGAW